MDNDDFDNDNDDMDHDQDDDNTPAALRRAAKEGKSAKAELAAARRELAMLKAGVDTSTKVGALFARAYDGDLDAEKIKAEWSEISGAATTTDSADTSTPATPDPEITDDERASTATRQAVASGANVTPARNDEDPRERALKAGRQVVEEGASEDEGLARHVYELFKAAADGDERVRIPSTSVSFE